MSGVGKTRLVSEFGAEARARDMRVLVGNCLELTTGDLPLGPVATILRELVRTTGQDRVAMVLGEAREEMARLVPALGSERAATEVADDPRVGADPDLDRREAQSRLFDQLLDALSRMGMERPTAAVLEDVQAADPATRDLISFLCTTSGTSGSC